MTKQFALKHFETDRLRIKADKHQLIKAGEQLAQKFPVDKLTTFTPVKRDSVRMITEEENKMIPELLGMRHQRMMKNTFSFFRGTAGLMEYDLHHNLESGLPLMICGDAHLNNFGFFASPERQLLFGLNDFDEARIDNWEVDLKRLLVSVQLVNEINGYDHKTSTKILSAAAKAYENGVNYSNDLPIMQRYYLTYNIEDIFNLVSEDDAQMHKVLKKIAKRAPKNNSDRAVKKLTTEDKGRIVFKEKPPRSRRIPNEIYQSLLKAFDQYCRNVAPNIRVLLSNFKISDIIRCSVGVGSFGTRCYLFLLTGKDGSHLVLQVKEASPSDYDLMILSNDQAKQQGYEEGRRVITAQKILQTFSDPFIGYTKTSDRSYYVRQFRDMKDSIDATKLDQESFTAYAKLCAFILATAHYQSPTAPMIFGYLDASKKFAKKMSSWAQTYAQQVHQDYSAFTKFLRGERQV